MKKFITSFALIISIFNYTFSQESSCGFVVDEEIVKILDGKNNEFQNGLKSFDLSDYKFLFDEVNKISMVVHIIRKSNKREGTTQEIIQASLDQVNEDYKNMNMEFVLCNINYIDDDQYFTSSLKDKRLEIQIAKHNNVNNVINVYCFPNVWTSWAYFPNVNQDWIVLRNAHIENRSTFSHELGHYFGLYHTHETYFCKEKTNGSNCSKCGDLICDTPADPNLSRKVAANCKYIGGGKYNPDVSNLMSYAPKSCRTNFTQKQKDRITAVFIKERAYLYGSCDNSLELTNQVSGDFSNWATTNGVEIIPGDFNGDGKGDIALLRQQEEWETLPIAFSDEDGTFNITNEGVGDFSNWAATNGVKIIPGDYNGDGKEDIALVRQKSGWETIPVALSKGDGTFSITNKDVGSFSVWAATSGVKIIPGDYNGDKKKDIALVRQKGGWETVPVALSNGDGTFSITNEKVDSFAIWAATNGVRIVPGDYNGDGKEDIALLRQKEGWETIPIAMSNGDGTFNITNKDVGNFSTWAATSEVKIIPGDYNGDGKKDIALIDQSGNWATVPVAYSKGNGAFDLANNRAGNFTTWVSATAVEAIKGDYNGDGKTDISLVRKVPGWATIPILVNW